MGWFSRWRNRTKDEAQPTEAATEMETAAEEQEAPTASKEETALLERVTRFRIADRDLLRQSFLTMQMYRFSAPFDRKDITDLVEALRFLGFRFYGFRVELGEREVPCEGLIGFKRAVHETEEEISGCSATGTYAGGRIQCHISAEGATQFSYDTTRPISLEPFEELFATSEGVEG